MVLGLKKRSLANITLAKHFERTTSSLVASVTGERITAEHAHSWPTRANVRPNAVAIEALMWLRGEHGSSMANVVNILVPLSTKTVAIGRILKLLI